MGKLKTTVPVRLYSTPYQAAILRAHCQEYIDTINVLVAALDSDVLPTADQDASTGGFTAALPGSVNNQALHDARSVVETVLCDCGGRYSRAAQADLPVEQLQRARRRRYPVDPV